MGRPAAIPAGRHAQALARGLINPAGRTVARFSPCCGYRVFVERLLEMREAAGLQILGRGDSQFGGEYPLQMKAADSRKFTQGIQGDLFICVCFDVAAKTPHQCRLSRRRIRGLTAKARSQPRLLSLLRRTEKAHVFAQRPPCRARWPAIDASGYDAEDKCAVRDGITLQYRAPARAIHTGRCGTLFHGRFPIICRPIAWKMIRMKDFSMQVCHGFNLSLCAAACYPNVAGK